MTNSRRSPLGYDQRLEAYYADEVLFIDNRPQTDIRDGYEAQRLAEAALASLAAGRTVDLRDGWQP